jgi:hypothetical protein
MSCHQALDRAPGDADTFAAQLPPHLARTVDLVVLVPHALNRCAPLVVPARPRRPHRRIFLLRLAQ